MAFRDIAADIVEPGELRDAEERAVLRLEAELDVAERKAWDALGRYKFQMFGYWAAIWVHINRLGQFKRPNPFKSVVMQARIQAGGV